MRRPPGVLSLLLVTLAALMPLAAGVPEFAFPLQANSVRLAVIGDTGTGEQPQIDVARQMVKSRAAFPFEFVIMLGDNIYTGSQPSDYEKGFDAAVQAAPGRRRALLRHAGQPRQDQRTVLQAVQHERCELLHLHEGPRAFLRARQQLHGPEAAGVARDQAAGGRQRRLEDLLLPSSAVLLRDVPRSGHGPAEGARASVRRVRRRCRVLRPRPRLRAHPAAEGHPLLHRRRPPARCARATWRRRRSPRRDSTPTARS